MTDAEDDKVKRLPVRFKNPAPEDRTLVRPHEIGKREPCDHSLMMGAFYVVDQKLAEIECGLCGAKLSPIWALVQLTSRDAHFQQAAQRYRDEQKRLAERSRTKCDRCGHMTRISRR